jgi:hypothetical protein
VRLQAEIDDAVTDFRAVATLAGLAGEILELRVEYQPAPHKPAPLPTGYMAVYAFWSDGDWLKIGKAGANSNARFQSQHYNASRAKSTLAASLIKAHKEQPISGFTQEDVGAWMRANTHRVNILLPEHNPKSLLALLEAFLHARLEPRFEGRS